VKVSRGTVGLADANEAIWLAPLAAAALANLRLSALRKWSTI